MARAEASIHIDRPPEAVFAFVADAANNPLWRKDVIETRWLDEGPMRVGRRGRQTAKVLGRAWTVEAEVVEWDPPRAATWRTVQGPVTVRSWCRVAPDGTGSLVSYGGDGGFPGPLGRLLTGLAVPRMITQAHLDQRTLRDRLESATGGRAPVDRVPATGDDGVSGTGHPAAAGSEDRA